MTRGTVFPLCSNMLLCFSPSCSAGTDVLDLCCSAGTSRMETLEETTGSIRSPRSIRHSGLRPSGTLWPILEREKKELGICWSFLPVSIAFCSSLLFSFPNADVLSLQTHLAPTFSQISYSQPCLEFLRFYPRKVQEKVLSSPVHLSDAWAVAVFFCQCKEGCQQALSRLAHTVVLVLSLVAHFL